VEDDVVAVFNLVAHLAGISVHDVLHQQVAAALDALLNQEPHKELDARLLL
jgi:hypothetical protein